MKSRRFLQGPPKNYGPRKAGQEGARAARCHPKPASEYSETKQADIIGMTFE